MEGKLTKLQIYYGASFLSTIAVIAKSYSLHDQFFPAFVHVIEWNIGRLIMLNFSLCLALLLCKFIIKIIFEELREYEEDKIWERFYFNLVEFCLTLTIFRMELSRSVVFNYVLMSICRMFHTVSAHRVRHMESQQRLSRIVYIKRFVFLYLLFMIDLVFIHNLISTMTVSGIDYRILFLTEYVILTLYSIRALGRYSLYLSGQLGGPEWEDRRGEVIFYLEVWVDILSSVNYVAFFIVVYMKYGLPFYLIRDLYISFLRVLQKINELRRFRRISQDFEDRFPDATKEDLREYDTVCNICLQEMSEGRSKKLICGHIFHSECLRNWFTNNQKCPICSKNLFKKQPKKPQPPPQQQNNNNNIDRNNIHQDLQQQIERVKESLRRRDHQNNIEKEDGKEEEEETILPNLPFGDEVLRDIQREGPAGNSYVRNLERLIEEYHRNIQRMNFIYYSRFRKIKKERDTNQLLEKEEEEEEKKR